MNSIIYSNTSILLRSIYFWRWLIYLHKCVTCVLRSIYFLTCVLFSSVINSFQIFTKNFPGSTVFFSFQLLKLHFQPRFSLSSCDGARRYCKVSQAKQGAAAYTASHRSYVALPLSRVLGRRRRTDTREETLAVVARIGIEKKALHPTTPPPLSSRSVTFSPSSPWSDHVSSRLLTIALDFKRY